MQIPWDGWLINVTCAAVTCFMFNSGQGFYVSSLAETRLSRPRFLDGDSGKSLPGASRVTSSPSRLSAGSNGLILVNGIVGTGDLLWGRRPAAFILFSFSIAGAAGPFLSLERMGWTLFPQGIKGVSH
jgi:hypothetical protein